MAGRIRTTKPEILDTDEKLAGATDAAFKMYFAIKLSADDAGRVRLNPQQLLMSAWWARPRTSWPDPNRLIKELAERNVIHLYRVGEAEYAEIVGWNDKGGPHYQAINKNQGARHPAPGDLSMSQADPQLPSELPSERRYELPEDDGRSDGLTTVRNVATSRVSTNGRATVVGPEDDGSATVSIRSDPNRSQTPAPASAIPLLPRTEPIPVDAKGHVTPEAIREESARLAQRIRSGGAS